jgi:putative N6-adenine-specific DNA methylase
VSVSSIPPRTLYNINLFTPESTRVVVRLAKWADIHTVDQLKAKLLKNKELWDDLYGLSDKSLHFRVVSSHSTLQHSKAVEERFLDVFGSPTSAPPPTAPPPSPSQLILVRIIRDTVTVSLDSSGEPLNARGYRSSGDSGKAPLRENVAAAMLKAAEYDPTLPLIDPFCGGGTILIEAALAANPNIRANLLASRSAGFSFQNWPSYTRGAFASIKGGLKTETTKTETTTSSEPPPAKLLLGLDRDAGVIEAARRNAKRAGVDHLIDFKVSPISNLAAAKRETFGTVCAKGLVLTNPPWGSRVSADKDLRNLYASLGSVLKKNLSNWGVGILTTSKSLVSETKLKGIGDNVALETSFGGQDPSLFLGTVR